MLKQRVITAVLLLVLILPAIASNNAWAWPLLSLIFCGAACWEWARMVARPSSAIASGVLLAILGVGVLMLDEPAQTRISLAVTVLACLFWFFLAPWRLRSLNAKGGSWPLALLLIFAAWLALVQVHRLGAVALIAAMAIVWIADIGAYFVGRSIGRRKLAPRISPGKSWEGAWGGMFLVLLAGLAAGAAPALQATLPARLLNQTGPLVTGLALALLCAYSVVGDLHESLLKRQAGVKDSSALLPGHGGVLDRIDALLPTMPAVYLLHEWLAHGLAQGLGRI